MLITRAGRQSDAFARALLERGAEPIAAPAIAIEPPDDPRAAEDALGELASFAWIVFTSSNGVDALFERLAARGNDARALANAFVAAIGERTAERLESNGIRADFVPAKFISEEVADAVILRSRPGDRVLLYRASDGRDVLPRALESAGRLVTVVAAYKTVVPHDPDFAAKVARADVLTFTSASSVRGFATLIGANGAGTAARGKCVACIGPITAEAANAAGLQVDVVASVSTTAGILDALEAYFARPQ